MTGRRQTGGPATGVRTLLALAAMLFGTFTGIRGTQDAVANGDTRTVEIYHEHTKESASVTFRRNGSYDSEGLKQLNWLLRDWRLDEPTRMEPRLFDIVWEVYREVGAREPIHVVSAYRSPQTNAMLRRRSRAVAEHSQHMRGFAMDFYLPGVSMARVREVGMRLQEGGVGFYPNALNPFVHLDAGSVRSWPRMSHDQLARLFPDGRTVHLPREGRPLEGYEVAKAEILARGGTVAGTSYAEAEEGGPRKSLWATLFGGGGGDDEDSDFYRSPVSQNRSAVARTRVAALQSAATAGNSDDGGIRGGFSPAPQPAPAPALRRTARIEPAPRLEPEPAAQPLPEPAVQAALLSPAAAQPAPGFEPRGGFEAAGPPPVLQRGPAIGAAPVPPRRPEEFAVAAGPLPPARPAFPGATMAAAEPAGEFRAPSRPVPKGLAAPAPNDDRAALRALFDAAATQTSPSRRADVRTSRTRVEPAVPGLGLADPGPTVRMAFSAAAADDIPADAFRGPAVAFLPTIR